MIVRKILGFGAALAVVLASSSPSQAATYIAYTGTNGSNLSAEADFSLSGTTLIVTLINTNSTAVKVPSDVLLGVFFNTNHKLTPISASLTALNDGSSSVAGKTAIFASPTDPKGPANNVGEGWGYEAGLSVKTYNAAIRGSGYGIGGLSDGNFYSSGVKLNGVDYGIVSTGGIDPKANSGVTGKNHGPLEQNFVQFTLTVASGFTLDEIGDTVNFQYGTALAGPNATGDPDLPGVTPHILTPEPAALCLFGFGIVGMAGYGWRRRKMA